MLKRKIISSVIGVCSVFAASIGFGIYAKISAQAPEKVDYVCYQGDISALEGVSFEYSVNNYSFAKIERKDIWSIENGEIIHNTIIDPKITLTEFVHNNYWTNDREVAVAKRSLSYAYSEYGFSDILSQNENIKPVDLFEYKYENVVVLLYADENGLNAACYNNEIKKIQCFSLGGGSYDPDEQCFYLFKGYEDKYFVEVIPGDYEITFINNCTKNGGMVYHITTISFKDEFDVVYECDINGKNENIKLVDLFDYENAVVLLYADENGLNAACYDIETKKMQRYSLGGGSYDPDEQYFSWSKGYEDKYFVGAISGDYEITFINNCTKNGGMVYHITTINTKNGFDVVYDCDINGRFDHDIYTVDLPVPASYKWAHNYTIKDDRIYLYAVYYNCLNVLVIEKGEILFEGSFEYEKPDVFSYPDKQPVYFSMGTNGCYIDEEDQKFSVDIT